MVLNLLSVFARTLWESAPGDGSSVDDKSFFRAPCASARNIVGPCALEHSRENSGKGPEEFADKRESIDVDEPEDTHAGQ
jgi:hypothetical protein